MAEEEVKNILRNIPNSVSGDGKTFVAALKNYLTKYSAITDARIDDSLGGATERPNHVTSITLLELHAVNDGVRSNNILVTWDITPVEDYAKSEVWYKTDSGWQKAGEASKTQYLFQGAETGKTYYIRVVAVNKKGNTADFDTAPQASIKIKGSQYIPAAPTQFILTWDEQGPLWKWLFEDNNYVDFFELRLDQNPGTWNDKRLDSTRETWSRANPGVRSGTAYLYIRNIFGEYSDPAVHQFNKALPKKPPAPVLTPTIDGVRIKMDPFPLGCTGYKLHIKTTSGEEENDDYFETVNSEYIYFFFIGEITVSYCFMDSLGEGEWSDTAKAKVKGGIDIGQVPTIDYDKFDDYIKGAIDIANAQPDINDLLKQSVTVAEIAIQQNTDSIKEAAERMDSAENNIDNLAQSVTVAETGIQQNADSITAIVKRVDSTEGDISNLNQSVTTAATAIQQNADSITTIAERVTSAENDVGNLNKAVTITQTGIQQNADSITAIAKRVTNAESGIAKQSASIQQNADSITAIVKRVDSTEGDIDDLAQAVTTAATAIQQNADSIMSVAKRVINTENGMEEHTSSIQQNADSITAVVKRVVSAEGDISNLNQSVTTAATAIQQNADSITAVAERVTSAESGIAKQSASIQQNADSITAIVKRVDSTEGDIDDLAQAVTTAATAIQQNADSIMSVAKRVINTENGMEEHSSSIQQNADSIAAAVTRVGNVEGTVVTQGTAIKQTADNITAVVTELNKKPADCNYSAISQLQDNILLTVKKDEVVNAINVSKEGIVIDGNKVHITGDTVFDNNVIIEGMIATDAITTAHLRANAVTSAKIQANAITTTKIAAGAVTADKIEAGAITAGKLAAGSVTADAIQTASIIGDKIAANTITGKHFAASNIDLTGALTITGGNVRLSQEGLRLSGNDGSATLFNQEGINYIDSYGITYAQVTKMIIGKAYDGQYIRFAAPWPTPPSVLMSPMTVKINDESYPAATLHLVCEATDVTVNGFKVNNYLQLGEGSYGVKNDERTDTTSVYNVLKMEQYWYGNYSYAYEFEASSDVMDVTFPETANYIELSLALNITNRASGISINYPGANNGHTRYDNSKITVAAQLYVGETKISEVTFTDFGEKKNVLLAGQIETGHTRAFVRILWKMYLNTRERGPWATLYNGRNEIARAMCKASLTKAYHKYSAATSKIARGYAMFLVTDGSTNIYTAEQTVQVLINYDGKPLAAKTITVDGVEHTTSLDGLIELRGNGSKEHIFAYGTAPTTKAVVNYTDGVITTIEIRPADITCYLRVLYDGKSVANDTVTVNGEAKMTGADGKIAIGGADKHTGEYVVAYGNDSTKVTVTYVAGSVTNVALYSIVDGSKVFTTEDNGTETFTVPAGITKLLLTATVSDADVPMGEDAQYYCSVTNTANNTLWGDGVAYSFLEDDGEAGHIDMRSVVEVTPRKEYTLKFLGAKYDTVDGIKFEWGKAINAMTASVVDK